LLSSVKLPSRELLPLLLRRSSTALLAPAAGCGAVVASPPAAAVVVALARRAIMWPVRAVRAGAPDCSIHRWWWWWPVLDGG
jgi:hypothetical protein